MASSYVYDKGKKKLVPENGITDPRPTASTQGTYTGPAVVTKPGVGGVNLSDSRNWNEYAGGPHINNTDMTDTGTGGSPEYLAAMNIWKANNQYGSPKDDPKNPGGGNDLPYGIGDAAAAGSDLAALIGDIGYTAPGAGGGVDPRIAQYQQQLQAYLDQYNQPVSYEKTWGDYAYEDLIRQALGMNYTDWTQGDQYAALRDRYTENGRNAMLDTLGQISARTGGLASSYASAASAQQYNEYMRLLEDAARAAYDKERGYVIENAGLAQGVGNQEYNRWYDITGLNNANRDRAVGILNDMLGYAYRDDDTAYSRGMTARDEARDRIASYLGNGGSIGDLDPALITASGLTTPELTKLEAAYQQPVVSYSGGGSGSGSGSGTRSSSYKDVLKKAQSYTKPAQAQEYLNMMVDQGYITADEASEIWNMNLGAGIGEYQPADTTKPNKTQNTPQKSASYDAAVKQAQTLASTSPSKAESYLNSLVNGGYLTADEAAQIWTVYLGSPEKEKGPIAKAVGGTVGKITDPIRKKLF